MVLIMKLKNVAFLFLAGLLTAGSFVACGGSPSGDDKKTPENTSTTTAADAATEEPDPFADFDYGGAEVRILVSANDYDGHGSSLFTIKNEDEETGDVVKDAVYKRNKDVEELLNVKFTFTENTDDYGAIPKTLQQVILGGDDAYELIIHDLFPLATLSMSAYFLNACDNQYFDFSQDYWYEDYMLDLAFQQEDVHYLLAGDYFLDILRTAHALFYNKDMFNSMFESADELYTHVQNGTWTHDVFLSYITDAYQDINGDGKADENDQYGFATVGYWGPSIPWVIGSDLTFLTYEADGAPKLALGNERSVKTLENLNKIFHNTASYSYADVEALNNAFKSGNALFSAYQRVRSLETFRDMKNDIGILPYPKLDEAQEYYITSSHDTANVGAIPMTCSKFEMMGAVLEVLSRETAKTVMPAYYETALKVKYSRDDASAQMLDIIRYNISCVFPVAYGNYCANLPLYNAFTMPLTNKNSNFMSNYEKKEKGAQKKLDELWNAFKEQQQ